LDGVNSSLRKYKRLIIAVVVVIIYVTVGSILSRGHVIAAPNSFSSCKEAGYPFTDTNPPACTVGDHTFLGPYAHATPSEAPVTSQPFEVLVSGDSEGDYPKSHEVITNQTQWQTFWSQIHSSLPTEPPLLPINFAQSDVITLSDGRQSTTGYTLEITSINVSTAGTTIYATESVPTFTCGVSYAPSNPYYIVSTDKLPPPISFDIVRSPHECK
jgi:hypothetical protein